VFGATVAHELESAYVSAGLQGYLQRDLAYSEAEAVLLCGFIDRGLVSVPNEWYGSGTCVHAVLWICSVTSVLSHSV
jgi:hypothetical protein